MYENHFGFSERPFELTPDPKFLYLSHGLNEIKATLIVGAHQRRGFVLLVGKPGTGKTTLLNSLMDETHPNTNYAYIFNPALDLNELLLSILLELNIASVDENLSRTKAMHRLNHFVIEQYKKQRNTVIIIDEAQYLERDLLESVRLLSNLETRKQKLIQIILSGQPELVEKLRDPKLKQLAQRIGLRCQTQPLNVKEVSEYIDHRLRIAGYRGPGLFTLKAKNQIWEFSEGIPRIINIVCENSLIGAYSEDKKSITGFMIRETIKDLKVIDLEASDQDQNLRIGKPRSFPGVAIPESSSPLPDTAGQDEPHQGFSIENLRRIILQRRASTEGEPGKKQTTVFFIVLAAGFFLTVNLLVFFFYSQNISELKNDFNLKVDSIKNNFQDQLNGISKDIKTLPIFSKEDAGSDPKSASRGEDSKDISPAGISLEGQVPKMNLLQGNTIIVKRGETLNEILIRVYGRADLKLSNEVLRLNPEIKNPDLILENQVIRLPGKAYSGIGGGEDTKTNR